MMHTKRLTTNTLLSIFYFEGDQDREETNDGGGLVTTNLVVVICDASVR